MHVLWFLPVLRASEHPQQYNLYMVIGKKHKVTNGLDIRVIVENQNVKRCPGNGFQLCNIYPFETHFSA